MAEGGCEGGEQLCPVLILIAAVAGGGWCFVFCSCCRVAASFPAERHQVYKHVAHMSAPPPPSSSTHIHTLHNYRTDDGPLSSFQGRSSSASSFHTSLFKAIDGLMSLALCPKVASPVPNTSDLPRSCHLSALLCPPVYLLGRFPSLRHIQRSTPTGVFESGCRPLTHSSLTKETMTMPIECIASG